MIEPMMSDTAQYEPVAWWFTRRRLGRELRNFYAVPEELPARLLTLVSELDGKPEVSLADHVSALHLAAPQQTPPRGLRPISICSTNAWPR
jgi:hypothetical protein